MIFGWIFGKDMEIHEFISRGYSTSSYLVVVPSTLDEITPLDTPIAIANPISAIDASDLVQ